VFGRDPTHQFEKSGLDAGRSAKPPQDARQSKYQFALYGRLGVIVGNHRGFEGLVIFGIFDRSLRHLPRPTGPKSSSHALKSAGVEFIDEKGGGRGGRLRKRQQKKRS
jgi:hypothetical protein